MDIQKRKLSVKHCPECKKRSLMLRQINIDLAVYLCRDKSCKYPEGRDWIMVNRSLDEMLHDNRQYELWKQRRKTTKIDKLVDSICNETTIDSAISVDSNQFEAQTINIDHLLNEQINKIQNDTSDMPDFDFDSFFGTPSECNESSNINNVKRDESKENSSFDQANTTKSNLENIKKCDENGLLNESSNHNDSLKVIIFDNTVIKHNSNGDTKTIVAVEHNLVVNSRSNVVNNENMVADNSSRSKSQIVKLLINNSCNASLLNKNIPKIITNSNNQNVKLLNKSSCNTSLVNKNESKDKPKPLILNHFILNKPIF